MFVNTNTNFQISARVGERLSVLKQGLWEMALVNATLLRKKTVFDTLECYFTELLYISRKAHYFKAAAW